MDGDRLYVLTETGDLACLRTQDGTVVWQRNILKDFSGRNIQWLVSESPLIDGNNVIVSPGGRGSGVVALDKATGKTVWASKELSDAAGYSSLGATTLVVAARSDSSEYATFDFGRPKKYSTRVLAFGNNSAIVRFDSTRVVPM